LRNSVTEWLVTAEEINFYYCKEILLDSQGILHKNYFVYINYSVKDTY
jgi:hypothetical protein